MTAVNNDNYTTATTVLSRLASTLVADLYVNKKSNLPFAVRFNTTGEVVTATKMESPDQINALFNAAALFYGVEKYDIVEVGYHGEAAHAVYKDYSGVVNLDTFEGSVVATNNHRNVGGWFKVASVGGKLHTTEVAADKQGLIHTWIDLLQTGVAVQMSIPNVWTKRLLGAKVDSIFAETLEERVASRDAGLQKWSDRRAISQAVRKDMALNDGGSEYSSIVEIGGETIDILNSEGLITVSNSGGHVLQRITLPGLPSHVAAVGAAMLNGHTVELTESANTF